MTNVRILNAARQQRPRFTVTIGSLVLLIMLASSIVGMMLPASAQTFLLQRVPEEQTIIGAKYQRPFFKPTTETELASLAGAYQVYLHVPVSSGLNFVGILPFVAGASDGESRASGLGNLYLGLQSRPDSAYGAWGSLSYGVYLPTAANNTPVEIVGTYANPTAPQFALPNVLTLQANYLYLNTATDRMHYGFELGPQFLLPTSGSAGNVEVYVHYGLVVGNHFLGNLWIAELAGLALITDDAASFGERTSHVLSLGTQRSFGNLSPGIFLQLPLDSEVMDIVDATLGFKIEYSKR